MTTPREPHRGPFEERRPVAPPVAQPAGGPSSGSGRPGRPRVGGPSGGPRPVPPPRVKPAWYRRPLPEVRFPARLPVLIGLGVLLVIAVVVWAVSSSGHSGSAGTPVAAAPSPSAIATASPEADPTPAAQVGTALPVAQQGRRVGTVTLLGSKAVSMVTGTPPTAGSFVAFQVRFVAAGGSLYTSPLSFSVPGASDGPVLNGGADPALSNTGLNDGRQITAYVTIQAPRHGRLYFSPDPSLPPTLSWTY